MDGAQLSIVEHFCVMHLAVPGDPRLGDAFGFAVSIADPISSVEVASRALCAL